MNKRPDFHTASQSLKLNIFLNYGDFFNKYKLVCSHSTNIHIILNYCKPVAMEASPSLQKPHNLNLFAKTIFLKFKT